MRGESQVGQVFIPYIRTISTVRDEWLCGLQQVGGYCTLMCRTMPLPQVGQTQLMLRRCFFLDVVMSCLPVEFNSTERTTHSKV